MANPILMTPEFSGDDQRWGVRSAANLTVVLILLTFAFLLFGQFRDGDAPSLHCGDFQIGTGPLLGVIVLCFLYFAVLGKRKRTLGHLLQHKARRVSPSTYRVLTVSLFFFVLTELSVFPQLWGQLVEQNSIRVGRSSMPVVALDDLGDALKGKAREEQLRILKNFAVANRPPAGTRELLSKDGCVHVVIGADGNSDNPDGTSVVLSPKGTMLNIAIAGNGTHRWNAFWFGTGGAGGSARLARQKEDLGFIILVAGSGGYGGSHAGSGGFAYSGLQDGFMTVGGVSGRSMWGGGAGGGGMNTSSVW